MFRDKCALVVGIIIFLGCVEYVQAFENHGQKRGALEALLAATKDNSITKKRRLADKDGQQRKEVIQELVIDLTGDTQKPDVIDLTNETTSSSSAFVRVGAGAGSSDWQSKLPSAKLFPKKGFVTITRRRPQPKPRPEDTIIKNMVLDNLNGRLAELEQQRAKSFGL